MSITSLQGRLHAGCSTHGSGVVRSRRLISQLPCSSPRARGHGVSGFGQLRLPAPATKRGIMASASDSGPASSDEGLTPDELRASMDEAVEREDYEEAAKLRDLLREAQMADPIVQLKIALKNSIDEENYKTAAEMRDQIRELVPVIDETVNDNRTGAECGQYSTTISHGIRVEAFSEYHPKISVPDCGQWFFKYSIKIHNQKTDGTIVQLKSRHWIVTDAEGHMDQVKGPGVVGEQPILSPGQSYEYTSACPLRTAGGCMQGEYEFHVWDQDVEDWTDTIRVSVGRFGLVVVEESNVVEDA